MRPAETIEKLRTEAFEELDAYFNQLQHLYEQDQLSEGDLDQAFSGFNSAFQTLGEKLGSWINQKPESYPAHVALSRWFLGQAWRYRGSTTYDQVSDRGRRGMQYHLEQAEGCARASLHLAQKPFLSFLVFAGVQHTHGNRLSVEDLQAGRYTDWYLEGLRVAPASLKLRKRLLSTLRTEWGGSDQHMLTYIRSQEGVISNADHQKLWAQFHEQMAHHAYFFQQNPQQALEYIEYAVQLNPALQDQRAFYLHNLQRKNEASEILFQLLKQHDGDDRFVLEDTATMVLVELLEGGHPDQEHVYRYLKAQAENGNLEAVVQAGELLENLPSLKASETPGFWYEKALQEGADEAGARLAFFVMESGGTIQQMMQHMHQGAEAGNAFCCGVLYENFPLYQRTLNLEERSKYKYLLRAADAGDNPSRMELVRLLKAGRMELGEDGILRPVHGKPTRESLEYAEHLQSRARAEGYKAAEGTERKKLFASVHRKQAVAAFILDHLRHWWVLPLVLWLGLRACSIVVGPSDASRTQPPTTQVGEDLIRDPEFQKKLQKFNEETRKFKEQEKNLTP